MRRAGPLSTWAPGPARRILKMFISKKTKEGGDTPPSTYMFVWAIHVSQTWLTPVHNFPGKLWTHAAFVADSFLYSSSLWLNLEKGLHQLTNSQGNCQPVSLNPSLHGLTISQGNRKRVPAKKNPEWQTKQKSRLVLAIDYPPTTSPTHWSRGA